MVVPLPTVLTKDRSARGQFDAIVITQLEQEVASRIKAFEAVIQDGEPERAKQQAVVDEVTEAFKAARERQHQSAMAFTAIQAEHTRKEEALQAAQKELRDFTPRVKELKKTITTTADALAKFREGPLKAFTTLRD